MQKMDEESTLLTFDNLFTIENIIHELEAQKFLGGLHLATCL